MSLTETSRQVSTAEDQRSSDGSRLQRQASKTAVLPPDSEEQHFIRQSPSVHTGGRFQGIGGADRDGFKR